jgi:hypothetical protein
LHKAHTHPSDELTPSKLDSADSLYLTTSNMPDRVFQKEQQIQDSLEAFQRANDLELQAKELRKKVNKK